MDQPLEQLSRRTQINRWRRLAETALAAYDLPAGRLTLLSNFANTTFRVDTPTGERYVLRIHRAHDLTVASVGAELAWLTALRRDTTVEVPDPVPARDGALLRAVATPGILTPHLCVLFRWLPGRKLKAAELTPAHLELVGEAMARLQNHAAQFRLPPEFTRPRVDGLIEAARQLPDPFAPEIIAACVTLITETLSADEAALVAGVITRIQEAEQAAGQDAATFGLIHADMHQNNLLFGQGTVRVIDFDDCGFGPRLYDPAVTLDQLLEQPNYPALRAGLLAGYRRVRPLSAADEVTLNIFIALRRLQDILWVVDAGQHPAINSDLDRFTLARKMLARLPGLLADGDHPAA